MKKLLLILLLAISANCFGQGNWPLTGAKNRLANGMGFGNKDTSTYTNASDTNLLVLQYPGSKLCYRHLLSDSWLVLGTVGPGGVLQWSDTGRANGKIATAFALNKVRDSLGGLVLHYLPLTGGTISGNLSVTGNLNPSAFYPSPTYSTIVRNYYRYFLRSAFQ